MTAAATPALSTSAFPAFDLLGEEVEIPRIEKALQALFDGGGEGGIARASLINLAVYNENPSELGKDASILAELTAETACRSLLVHADTRSPESGARAWVQAHCQIGRDGKKTVCTEQISFILAGRSPGLLRNVVLAHLDSDLPLAFWWRGEFSDAFEERLYSRIDRLLYDSETWESPRNQFLRLLECQRGASSPFVMHDLAFTRLNAVRQAVANVFDRPLVSRQLPLLSEVRIRHAEGFRLSGLYLAAWIAGRLGATIAGTTSTSGDVRCLLGRGEAGGEFRIALSRLDSERLGSVEIDFQLGDVRVEISRCQTRDFIRTLVHRPGTPVEEHWLPARRMHDAALVADVLNRAGRNRTHGQILPGVLELLALR